VKPSVMTGQGTRTPGVLGGPGPSLRAGRQGLGPSEGPVSPVDVVVGGTAATDRTERPVGAPDSATGFTVPVGNELEHDGRSHRVV